MCKPSMRGRSRRDHLAQKLEEADAKLREARADRKESERDRRMADAVEQLKRFFPGAPACMLPGSSMQGIRLAIRRAGVRLTQTLQSRGRHCLPGWLTCPFPRHMQAPRVLVAVHPARGFGHYRNPPLPHFVSMMSAKKNVGCHCL